MHLHACLTSISLFLCEQKYRPSERGGRRPPRSEGRYFCSHVSEAGLPDAAAVEAMLAIALLRLQQPGSQHVGMIKLPNIFILWYTGDNGSFVLKRPGLPLQHTIMGRMRLCRTLFLFPATVILFVETGPTCSHCRPQKKRR